MTDEERASFAEWLLRKDRGRPETHEQRVWHHMYETLEGIREQSERIARLEELAIAMWPFVSKADRMQWPELVEHMRELGLEVE